ncbi:uncharacterized protein BO72DRAFT_491748 [Aspergillus fijiensis CBS 313.89]|uniref:Uncharacterized protein n=1 Tax=Aspergillus fijiensis CBS 313.89 TaxID=1448319 RepID=A0A8G1W2K2_9EURO|nr:uncharacterized protein BO72DRAFT_491748 [Aspergillus fijiensis CBS 313.89]RAK82125.1 hypothetical protein BO72DRAFT_491748 [Aspergillus fijiensis CBS 313.89]
MIPSSLGRLQRLRLDLDEESEERRELLHKNTELRKELAALKETGISDAPTSDAVNPNPAATDNAEIEAIKVDTMRARKESKSKIKTLEIDLAKESEAIKQSPPTVTSGRMTAEEYRRPLRGSVRSNNNPTAERDHLITERDDLAAEHNRLIIERDSMTTECDNAAVKRNRVAAEFVD